MKLSLRQKEYLSAAISAIGFVILFLVKAEWRKTVGVLFLVAGMVAMGVNLAGNYILWIYSHQRLR